MPLVILGTRAIGFSSLAWRINYFATENLTRDSLRFQTDVIDV